MHCTEVIMSLIAGNLAVVQRLLDEQRLTWGICAGAAAHLYGNRRPIQDIDLLVMPGKLSTVVQLLQRAQKAVQFDGQRILWRGIKVFDDLGIRRNGVTHPFTLDTLMAMRLRRLSLLGAPVAVLAPEDVLVHKLLLGRGADMSKHDHADAQGIARRQTLDPAYICERLRLMNAPITLREQLEELGVELPVSV
jgi:hypothetical protein